jgi:CRISPR-associated protein Csx14
MPTQAQRAVLIATLGTKPQVVTTAADLLLAAGHSLAEVKVLHTLDQKGVLAPALETLSREFTTYADYQALTFTLVPIRDMTGTLPDVESAADAEAVFRALYRRVWQEKRAGSAVHLSIVGGRKVFAVYGMATAQLLFGEEDCLWYVSVGGEFLASEGLHPAAGDDAHLIPIPVMRWRTVSPVLTDLSQIDDPFRAVERQRTLRLQESLDEARAFVLGVLSPAERRVVEPLVREGPSNTELAVRLSLSPRTVERHLGEISSKAAVHWGLPDVSRTQLVALLNLYYALKR